MRDFGWTERTLKKLGEAIRPLVAELCSTASVTLEAHDVDFVPVAYQPGAVANNSFELETFGYPDRVEILTEARVLALKAWIIDFVHEPHFVAEQDRQHFTFSPDQALVWVKFVDPRGVHV